MVTLPFEKIKPWCTKQNWISLCFQPITPDDLWRQGCGTPLLSVRGDEWGGLNKLDTHTLTQPTHTHSLTQPTHTHTHTHSLTQPPPHTHTHSLNPLTHSPTYPPTHALTLDHQAIFPSGHSISCLPSLHFDLQNVDSIDKLLDVVVREGHAGLDQVEYWRHRKARREVNPRHPGDINPPLDDTHTFIKHDMVGEKRTEQFGGHPVVTGLARTNADFGSWGIGQVVSFPWGPCHTEGHVILRAAVSQWLLFFLNHFGCDYVMKELSTNGAQ